MPRLHSRTPRSRHPLQRMLRESPPNVPSICRQTPRHAVQLHHHWVCHNSRATKNAAGGKCHSSATVSRPLNVTSSKCPSFHHELSLDATSDVTGWHSVGFPLKVLLPVKFKETADSLPPKVDVSVLHAASQVIRVLSHLYSSSAARKHLGCTQLR